jgi:membrane associated rhomboid family serine protease
MFPLHDENPIVRTPVATIIIIGLNVAAWFFLQGMGSARPLAGSLCQFGLFPGDLLGFVPAGVVTPVGAGLGCALGNKMTWYTPVTSMFMHGGWFHIITNLWFLWVFGDNVEDAMGPYRFLVFYLLCGLAAAALQTATNPTSTIPMVGASGAIGGVMGAYARLYPRARIRTLVFVMVISVPAVVMLGYWLLIQILGGLPALGGEGGGVAFWAHIGGFISGLLLIGLFRRPEYVRQHLHYGR